jgi:lipoate-protein ligase A
VLGRACNLTDDVYLAACQRDGIPVLRRASGGGTVLQGPGCLSYAFVVPIALHPDFMSIRATNQFILQRVAKVLRRWQPDIAFQGISDLTVEGLKISGNAQRRKRRALLFHGTILYGMQADLIARYLKQPKRQPDYRGNRTHGAFLRTVDAPPHEMKQAIADAWCAHVNLEVWPRSRMASAIANIVERSLN